MQFQRGGNTLSTIGIGRLTQIKSSQIFNANELCNNFSEEEMKIMFDKVHNRISGISLDGVDINDLSNHDQVYFNNQLVKGLKAARRRAAKIVAKSEFVEGDVIEILLNGTKEIMNVSFKSKGRPHIDNKGRIRGWNNQYRISAYLKNGYRKLEGEEKETWIKEQKLEILKGDQKTFEQEIKWHKNLLDGETKEDKIRQYTEYLERAEEKLRNNLEEQQNLK